MATYNYRCTRKRDCGSSTTLKKPIDQYVRRPKCPGCKRDTLKSVNDREKARNKRRVCTCGEIRFPHHRGTEPWCKYAKVGPTEQDYLERYRNSDIEEKDPIAQFYGDWEQYIAMMVDT